MPSLGLVHACMCSEQDIGVLRGHPLRPSLGAKSGQLHPRSLLCIINSIGHNSELTWSYGVNYIKVQSLHKEFGCY